MKDGARGGFGLTAEPSVVVEEITEGEFYGIRFQWVVEAHEIRVQV